MILEWKIKFVIALQIVICKNLKCVLCTACRYGEIQKYAAAWVKGTCCGLASPQTCVRLWALPHGKAVKEPESDWRKSWRKGGLRCVLQGKAGAEQAERRPGCALQLPEEGKGAGDTRGLKPGMEKCFFTPRVGKHWDRPLGGRRCPRGTGQCPHFQRRVKAKLFCRRRTGKLERFCGTATGLMLMFKAQKIANQFRAVLTFKKTQNYCTWMPI